MKNTVTWKYSIITPPPTSPKHSLTHQCPVKAPPHALSMIAPNLFDKMSPNSSLLFLSSFAMSSCLLWSLSAAGLKLWPCTCLYRLFLVVCSDNYCVYNSKFESRRWGFALRIKFGHGLVVIWAFHFQILWSMLGGSLLLLLLGLLVASTSAF